MTIQDIDKELLALHKKLHESPSVVVQHRLLQQINQLLDQRLELKTSEKSEKKNHHQPHV